MSIQSVYYKSSEPHRVYTTAVQLQTHAYYKSAVLARVTMPMEYSVKRVAFYHTRKGFNVK